MFIGADSYCSCCADDIISKFAAHDLEHDHARALCNNVEVVGMKAFCARGKRGDY